MEAALLDITKAVVTSWPFWVAIIASVFIVVFRASIRNLLGRITGIGGGAITAATATAQDAQAHPPRDPRAAADELLAQLDNQYVREIEGRIREELDRRGLRDNPAEATRVLTRYTAVAFMAADFESIESTIWASQVLILEDLNAIARAPADRLREHYDRAAAAFPAFFANYPFDRYMGYLENTVLVVRQDGDHAITVKGRTYLMWRVNQGKPRHVYG